LLFVIFTLRHFPALRHVPPILPPNLPPTIFRTRKNRQAAEKVQPLGDFILVIFLQLNIKFISPPILNILVILHLLTNP
jgi:hypothetical protein